MNSFEKSEKRSIVSRRRKGKSSLTFHNTKKVNNLILFFFVYEERS